MTTPLVRALWYNNFVESLYNGHALDHQAMLMKQSKGGLCYIWVHKGAFQKML